MAFTRNYRAGVIKFDAANQVLDDMTEKLNIASISYQGGTGAFTLVDGQGNLVDEGTTNASQTDVTHYLLGKEIVGITPTVLPASGIIIVQLHKGRG